MQSPERTTLNGRCVLLGWGAQVALVPDNGELKSRVAARSRARRDQRSIEEIAHDRDQLLGSWARRGKQRLGRDVSTCPLDEISEVSGGEEIGRDDDPPH